MLQSKDILASSMFFVICTLTVFSMSFPAPVYASSPFDSGYGHGCSDAGIFDPSSRYINEPGKGPSFHSDDFMSGYYAGFSACSHAPDQNNEKVPGKFILIVKVTNNLA